MRNALLLPPSEAGIFKKRAVWSKPGSPLQILFIQPEAYAFPTEPNNFIFSTTVALIASVPGANNLRGSKPFPCKSFPASMYLRVASANTTWHSVLTLIFATPS